MTSRVLCRVSRLLEHAAETGPVLGLDTSNQIASLAVVARGRVAGRVAHPVTSHGASLPGVVDELLSSAGFKIRDLAAIAVGIGPGSFTGLRIGLSYAKGLAMASGCAVVGVPGFDAMALAAIDITDIPIGRLLAVVVDARKNEVYATLYRVVADGLEKLTEDLVVTLEQLASRITEDVTFIGDSTAKDAAALVGMKGHKAAVFETGTLDTRGVSVAAIGAVAFTRGEMDRVASLEPLYIRAPEATFKSNLKRSGEYWHGGRMEHREEELIRQHLTHDEALKSLYSEHQELKRKLEVFRSKHYLTNEEEIEEKRIQKLKLASKDRMMEILGRYRNGNGNGAH